MKRTAFRRGTGFLAPGRVTSVASDRSASKVPGEEEEKTRREYEYKIATMQNRITGLERDLEDADEKGRNNADGNARGHNWNRS